MADKILASVEVVAETTRLTRGIEDGVKKANVTVRPTLDSSSIENFSRPLGKISVQASEFSRSMDAANARVLAFGASAAVLGGVSRIFDSIISSTIEVDKSLNEISATIGISGKNIESLGRGIFDVAKQTGSSFKVASEAVLEFSRQGLSASDALERTNAALVLVRTTGISAAEAVNGLTAAFSVFGGKGLEYEDIVNKMAAVDAKFAVGSKDLIEGISRSASIAQEAKVSFEELTAFITVLQEKTARGGAVIGNSLKNIFTRLQSPEALKSLQAVGVTISDDITGEALSATQIIRNLAKEFDNLGSSERKAVLKSVGGGFQIDKFAALLGDIKQANSRFDQAISTARGGGNDAFARNKKLDDSIAAQFNKAQVAAAQLSSTVGEIAFSSEIKGFLSGTLIPAFEKLNSLISGVDELTGEKSGKTLGAGIVKGLSGILLGPGLLLAAGFAGKLALGAGKFGAGAVGEILGANEAKRQQIAIEKSIFNSLKDNESLQSALGKLEGNKVAQAKLLSDEYIRQATQLERMGQLSKALSKPVYDKGVRYDREGSLTLADSVKRDSVSPTAVATSSVERATKTFETAATKSASATNSLTSATQTLTQTIQKAGGVSVQTAANKAAENATKANLTNQIEATKAANEKRDAISKTSVGPAYLKAEAELAALEAQGAKTEAALKQYSLSNIAQPPQSIPIKNKVYGTDYVPTILPQQDRAQVEAKLKAQGEKISQNVYSHVADGVENGVKRDKDRKAKGARLSEEAKSNNIVESFLRGGSINPYLGTQPTSQYQSGPIQSRYIAKQSDYDHAVKFGSLITGPTQASKVESQAISGIVASAEPIKKSFSEVANNSFLLYTAVTGVTSALSVAGEAGKAFGNVLQSGIVGFVQFRAGMSAINELILKGKTFSETLAGARAARAADTGGFISGAGAFVKGGGLQAAGAALGTASVVAGIAIEAYSAIDSVWKYFGDGAKKAQDVTLALAAAEKDLTKAQEIRYAVIQKQLIQENSYSGEGFAGFFNKSKLNFGQDFSSKGNVGAALSIAGGTKEGVEELATGLFSALEQREKDSAKKYPLVSKQSSADTKSRIQFQASELIGEALRASIEEKKETVGAYGQFGGASEITTKTVNQEKLLSGLVERISAIKDENNEVAKAAEKEAQAYAKTVDLVKKHLDVIQEIASLQANIPSQQENQIAFAKELASTSEKERIFLDFKEKSLRSQRESAQQIKNFALQEGKGKLNEYLNRQGIKVDDPKRVAIEKAFTGLAGAEGLNETVNAYKSILDLIKESGLEQSELLQALVDGVEPIKVADDIKQRQFKIDASTLSITKQLNNEYSTRRDLITAELNAKQRGLQLEKESLAIKNETSDLKFQRGLFGLTPLQRQRAELKRAAETEAARETQNYELEKKAVGLSNQESIASGLASKNVSPDKVKEILASKSPLKAAADELNRQNDFGDTVKTAGQDFYTSIVEAAKVFFGGAKGESPSLGINPSNLSKSGLENLKKQIESETPKEGEDVEKFQQNRADLLKKISEVQSNRFVFTEENLGKLFNQRVLANPISRIQEKGGLRSDELSDFDRQQKFGGSFEKRLGEIKESGDLLGKQLGNDIPNAFRDSMFQALKDISSGTKGLKESLLGAATAFLSKINDSLISNSADNITGVIGSLFTKKATGGLISGGSGNRDDVPALLMGGEFVINKNSVSKYGADFLSSLNSGKIPKFASGGPVGFTELNSGVYRAPDTYAQYGSVKSGKLTFDKNGNVVGLDGYSGLSENKADALKRRQANFYGAGAQTGEGGFFTPGQYGLGAIQGQKSLLSFLTQQTASTRYDKIGAGGIDIAAGSSNLSLFALTDSGNLRSTGLAKAKEQAQDLYFGGISAQKEKATKDYEEKKRYEEALRQAKQQAEKAFKQVLISAAVSAVSSYASTGFKNGFNTGIGKAEDASGVALKGFDRFSTGFKSGFSNFGESYTRIIPTKKLLAKGGYVAGGSGMQDDVPASLTGGEFVISKQAAKNIGYGALQKMNATGKTEGGGDNSAMIAAKFDELIEKLNAVGSVNITVNSTGDGKDNSRQSGNSNRQTQEMARQIKEAVLGVLKDEKRLGGIIR